MPLVEERHNALCRLLRDLTLGVEDELRCEGLFIGIGDAGKSRKFPAQRLGVEAAPIPPHARFTLPEAAAAEEA